MTLDDLAAHRTEATVAAAHPVERRRAADAPAELARRVPPARRRDARRRRRRGRAAVASPRHRSDEARDGDPRRDVPRSRVRPDGDRARARRRSACARCARRSIPNAPRRATSSPDRGGTIFLCVVDEDGMAVSLIESLYMNFGSGIVAGRHRRSCCKTAARTSRTKPGHPNVYEGGKRPVHTLSPPMFLRDGSPEIVFGTMGGDGQPQIQLQFLHQLVDRGLDVQRALDHPRWIYGRHTLTERPDLATGEMVLVESRMPDDIVAGLERRGHGVEALGPYENAMGHAHGDRDRPRTRHARRRQRPARGLARAGLVTPTAAQPSCRERARARRALRRGRAAAQVASASEARASASRIRRRGSPSPR